MGASNLVLPLNHGAQPWSLGNDLRCWHHSTGAGYGQERYLEKATLTYSPLQVISHSFCCCRTSQCRGTRIRFAICFYKSVRSLATLPLWVLHSDFSCQDLRFLSVCTAFLRSSGFELICCLWRCELALLSER